MDKGILKHVKYKKIDFLILSKMDPIFDIACRQTASNEEIEILKKKLENYIKYPFSITCVQEWLPLYCIDIYVFELHSNPPKMKDHLRIFKDGRIEFAYDEYYIDGLELPTNIKVTFS